MGKLGGAKSLRKWTIKYYYKTGKLNYQYIQELESVLFRIKFDDFTLFRKVVFSRREEKGLIDLFVCKEKKEFLEELSKLMAVDV